MPSETGLSRRALMGAALAASFPFRSGAADAGGIVCLDYGLASTLLSMGVTPAAVVARSGWSRWVVDPPIPEGVADVGAASEINLEILLRLKPRLILSIPYLSGLTPQLERIAPVRSFSIYAEGNEALPASVRVTRELGQLIGREQEADAFLVRADAVFDECRQRLATRKQPPVALITLLDERHARIFGGPGLYQGALDRLGLVNAWQQPAGYWGFQTIALEALVALPGDARLMVFEPLIPADILRRLGNNPLWSQLPCVRAQRVSVLPGVLMFGMVREAMRFAQIVTQELEQHA